MAVELPDVSRLKTDTQIYYTKTIVDQIEARYPIVKKMKKSNIKIWSGGSEVQMPITYERNNQTQHYAKSEQMGSATENKRSYAKHTLRYTQTPVKYDVEDFTENNGSQVTIDTIAAEVEAAQMGQIFTMSQNGFGIYDGSDLQASAPTSKQPLSLNAALTHNTTYNGVGSYGGITRDSQTDYFNGVSGDGSNNDVNDLVPVTYAQWDFMVDSCLKFGAKRGSLMAVCGSALYLKWKSLVRAKESGLTAASDTFKVGFAAFSIDGVDIVLDDNCPDNTFYLLDMDSWMWYISQKRNFLVTDFQWQGSQNDGIDEWLSRVLVAHTGLVCNKPRNNYFTVNMS